VGSKVRAMVATGAVLTATLGWLAIPLPAQAHGALATPVSRAEACGDDGNSAGSAACRAALAASAPGASKDWDAVKVANVNGRDRSVIPDGQLCSGGLDEFAGLDLARTDWPTTRLTAGASFTFRYVTTIPHNGSFRFYITNSSYRPGTKLRWSALESRPFLTVTNPSATNGAYVLRGRLPSSRTGRQLIYTIWQTTSTPDTYYSCSDVVMNPAQGTAAGAPTKPRATRSSVASPSATAPHGAAAGTPSQSEPAAAPTKLAASPAAQSETGTSPMVLLAIGIAAAVALGIAGVAGFLLTRSGPRTAGNGPEGPDPIEPPEGLGRHRR
jgi:predicted carbohydrate-binding protein with CBM5 and CBM33 domain